MVVTLPVLLIYPYLQRCFVKGVIFRPILYQRFSPKRYQRFSPKVYHLM